MVKISKITNNWNKKAHSNCGFSILPNFIKMINIMQRIPYSLSPNIIDNIISKMEYQIIAHRENVKSEKLLGMLVNPLLYKINSLSKLKDFIGSRGIDKFFCPITIDFRGRAYAYSILSFTNIPESRGIEFFENKGKIVFKIKFFIQKI